MKKMVILLLLCNVSQIQYGQIIANHTVVDKYDDIPQYYINEVKKMWLSYAGESHSNAIRVGLTLLESINPAYAVSQISAGTPEPYTTSNLRVNEATWGSYRSGPTGWIHFYGEQDWYTSAGAITQTKASLNYCATTGPALAAFGFGWCYDPDYMSSASVSSYLSATQQYISHCSTRGYPTKVFFTTGPVDDYSGLYGYNNHLRWKQIRDYVALDPTRILFDYADILCWSNAGVPTTQTSGSYTYPAIVPANYTPITQGHISDAGSIRLAKAMWWMLARMAGWDGGAAAPVSTWLGVTGDWNNASNWNGGIPSLATDVVISSTLVQPIISGLPSAVGNNLTINAGASLTVNSSNSLSVGGNLSNSGTLTVLSGNTDNSGSLIVRGTSTGSVTYNRFLRPEDNFGDRHFFASPVSGQSVSGFSAANSNKISVIDSKYQIWMWNEELLSGNWLLVPSSGNIISGKGYNVDQRTGSDGMLGFTGAVVNTASFTATSPYVTGYTARTTLYDYGYLNPNPIWSGTRSWTNYGGGGWNLMGNPFTSAMDAAAFISTNSLKFDPYYMALYIYDGVNNVYRYVAASAPGFLEDGSSGSYVQAGQGFFVIALYNNIVFNFNAAMQIHSMAVPVLKSAGTEAPWPGLQLKVKYGSREGMTTIVYNNQMTAGLEPGYDVGLMSTGPEVEIYTSLVSENNNVKLTRQALPVIGGANIIIPIGVDSKKGGEVTFSANTVPFENYSFWLEDRTKGLFTDLTSNTYLTTLPANTSGSGRFFIYASTNTPSERELQPKDSPVDVWTLNGRVIINGYVSDLAFCEVFNLLGQKVMMTNLFDGELNTINVSSVTRGIYLVRVVDGLKIINRKLVLN